jgi:hypothetical protein
MKIRVTSKVRSASTKAKPHRITADTEGNLWQPDATNMRTLWCEIGEHEWQRPRQKGKPPHNCPEHNPLTRKPAPRKPPTKAPEQKRTNPFSGQRRHNPPQATPKPDNPFTRHARGSQNTSHPGIPDYVVRRLTKAGLPIPDRARVDAIGYSSREMKHIRGSNN